MDAIIRLGARSAVIVAVLSVVVLAALNRDSTGSTFGHFQMGGIELKIDSKGVYNGVAVPSATWAMKDLVPGSDKFFNFPDVKPGDFGCETVSVHVEKGNAYLCLDFKNLSNKDNRVNEPESLVDPNGNSSGELANNLQFFGWLDNGDGIFKNGEKILFGTTTKAATTVLNNMSYPLGDAKNFGTCRQSETRYVGMCWCAGTLTVNLQTGKMSCDGSTLGNIAQTDSMSIDVSVRAVSSDDQPKFTCSTGNVTPPPPPKHSQYCSHGYWKQSHHFDNWVGYSPNQQFSSVFDNAFPGETLFEVLQNGGGGLNRLGRETVGALLNAGKLSNFPYTQSQVKSMFNAAYPGSNSAYNTLADKFELDENCPLN